MADLVVSTDQVQGGPAVAAREDVQQEGHDGGSGAAAGGTAHGATRGAVEDEGHEGGRGGAVGGTTHDATYGNAEAPVVHRTSDRDGEFLDAEHPELSFLAARFVRRSRCCVTLQMLALIVLAIILLAEGSAFKSHTGDTPCQRRDRRMVCKNIVVFLPSTVYFIISLKLLVVLSMLAATCRMARFGLAVVGRDVAKMLSCGLFLVFVFMAILQFFIIVTYETSDSKARLVNILVEICSTLLFMVMVFTYCLLVRDVHRARAIRDDKARQQAQRYLPSDTKFSTLDGVNTQCSICLADYEADDDVIQLPCGHVYHPDCIRGWLGDYRHRRCPMRCKESPYQGEGVLPPRGATVTTSTTAALMAPEPEVLGVGEEARDSPENSHTVVDVDLPLGTAAVGHDAEARDELNQHIDMIDI